MGTNYYSINEILSILENEEHTLNIEHESKFDKDFFIESLLKDRPIGMIILCLNHVDDAGRYHYEVIDGKKRLEAIKDFLTTADIDTRKKVYNTKMVVDVIYDKSIAKRYRMMINQI